MELCYFTGGVGILLRNLKISLINFAIFATILFCPFSDIKASNLNLEGYFEKYWGMYKCLIFVNAEHFSKVWYSFPTSLAVHMSHLRKWWSMFDHLPISTGRLWFAVLNKGRFGMLKEGEPVLSHTETEIVCSKPLTLNHASLFSREWRTGPSNKHPKRQRKTEYLRPCFLEFCDFGWIHYGQQVLKIIVKKWVYGTVLSVVVLIRAKACFLEFLVFGRSKGVILVKSDSKFEPILLCKIAWEGKSSFKHCSRWWHHF